MVKDQKISASGKKILTGKVISDKMQKTILVEVERSFRHPLFDKTIRTKRTYKVHDEAGKAKVGDYVSFFESRPISKTKYMNLEAVLQKSANNER